MAATLYPDQDTAYTREGTLAHEIAESAVSHWLDGFAQTWTAGLVDIPPEMIRHAEEYRDYIEEQIKSPDAVVLLEQRLDFSPWVPDGFGTGDCLIIQGRRLDVIDYKYGQGVAVSAVDNSQMRLYGLGAINDLQGIYEIDEVHLHIFQPRKDNISVEELTASELLAWGEKIRPIAADAAEGRGEHLAGEHCRFCPHAGQCTTLAAACQKAVDLNGGVAAVASLAPWQVAEILAQEAMITAWLKAVKDRALASLLEGDEIPGFKVVSGRSTRAWADELEVCEALLKAGYSREQITKTEVLSPAAMERVLGKKKAAELIAGHIVSTPGAPTVAPESDKRPVFDRLAEAQKDFN